MNEVAGHVYRQVIAVDAFGGAVIMSMLSIRTEIESGPTVIRVCLPSTKDIRK